MILPEVDIFSDWWARPNPGPWGYWVVMKYKWVIKEFSWFEDNTTNNRMELTGAIIWLEKLTKKSKVNLHTDSQYTINGIEKWWAIKWRENNWMRTKSEKATNYDLWERLLNIVEKHEVKFHWVKWHNWHIENERCDELATEAILKNKNPHPNPLLKERGQEDELTKIWIVENYWKVPNYILELSRELRQKQTNAEKFLWELLRNRQLNNLKFRRQYAFWRYIADFYCFEKNLVIELDWWIHNLKEQIEYDKIRTEIISKNKVNILRIKNEELFDDIESVLKKILYFCSCSSPSGEVGWGFKIDKNIKITAEWQACRKCWTSTIKAIPKKKNTKNKSYYYKYYLTCPGCNTNYFIDEAKVMI
jgi:ribonuclease HI